MTVNHRAADVIGTSAQKIRLLWPVMQLQPSASIARARPGSDAQSHQMAVLDTRRQAEQTLAHWARFIVSRRHITKTIPDSLEDLCLFIDRHALWLASQQPEVTAQAVKDLAQAANRCRAVAFPNRSGGLWIGDCPNTVGRDGESVTCGAPVRVNAEHPGDIRCKGCGLEDTLDGWVLRIVGTEGPYTASQLVAVLHRRLGIVVSESGIRQWVRRGVIEPIKDGFVIRTTPDGAYLYDIGDVMTRITQRERRAQE